MKMSFIGYKDTSPDLLWFMICLQAYELMVFELIINVIVSSI